MWKECVCGSGKSNNVTEQARTEDGYHLGQEVVLSLLMNFQIECLAAVMYCVHDTVMILELSLNP